MNANVLKKKIATRLKRKKRIRAKVSGCAERPRVSVFRSNKYFYAQAIDDVSGRTLAACDGAKMELKANREDAKKLAVAFAASLKDKKISKIVFDNNGYGYHGVVASFADELRNNSIEF
ncbi:MAG: large subunit ribosomal protein [Campylobacterota bacterium]|nr:large subunit ribosomal protein [Campylobacterota bacterium]